MNLNLAIQDKTNMGPDFWDQVVTDLSFCESMPELSKVVTEVARTIAQSDGTTFVLKEEDRCYYFDERAISPLWKGQKFPASTCISGWAMIHKKSAIIADIYKDSRIPHEAYRPTFVKSLCMIPVREADPIAAIGSYWSQEYTPSEEQLKNLQILTNLTAVSIEKIQLKERLQKELFFNDDLHAKNKELEIYLCTLAHDLRTPLMTLQLLVSGFKRPLLETKYKDHVSLVEDTIQRMAAQINKMMSLYRLNCQSLLLAPTDVGVIFSELASHFSLKYKHLTTEIDIQPRMIAQCDKDLMTIVLENLLSNSFKFSKPQGPHRISFSCESKDKEAIFSVRDNGVGFQPEAAKNLFRPMVRLHNSDKYPGTGLGLASVAKIIQGHGGRAWAEGSPSEGATIYFSLPV